MDLSHSPPSVLAVQAAHDKAAHSPLGAIHAEVRARGRVVAATVSMGAQALELDLTFERCGRHKHATPGQSSEIPAFDAKTNTIWVVGVVGVDVLGCRDRRARRAPRRDAVRRLRQQRRDPQRPRRTRGRSGARTAACRASCCSTTRARARWRRGINQVTVGALPDMLTFTHDGRKLLVANEATPNAVADAPYTPALDPPGSVSIIDVARRTVVATAGFDGVPVVGDNVRLPASTGMDFEPEYIAVGPYGEHAYVTLQEANAIGVLDLRRGAFTRVIGLGAKDFNLPGNEIDPEGQRLRSSTSSTSPRKGLVHAGRHRDLQLARHPAARDGQRRRLPRGQRRPRRRPARFGGVAPLDRLRVSNTRLVDAGNLFAAGARSFSIRGPNGALIYDSGSLLDREAAPARPLRRRPQPRQGRRARGRRAARSRLEDLRVHRPRAHDEERRGRVRRHQSVARPVRRHDRHGRRSRARKGSTRISTAGASTSRSRTRRVAPGETTRNDGRLRARLRVEPLSRRGRRVSCAAARRARE